MKKNKIIIMLIMIFGVMLVVAGCLLSSVEPLSTSLDLSGQNLDKLDLAIFENSELEVLNISNNNLSDALPSQIDNLKNLKVLNASNNNFTGMPAEIGHLIQLEDIDFSNNNLSGLPLELGNLKNLKKFNISGNEFSEEDLNIIRESLPDMEFITM